MVTRMRSTRSHTGHRRSHIKLKNPPMTKDAGGITLRHRVSPVTGTYKGKVVIDLSKKTAKKSKKQSKVAESNK